MQQQMSFSNLDLDSLEQESPPVLLHLFASREMQTSRAH